MTPDGDKIKAELLQELETLRHRISELEQTRKEAEQELKQYQFMVESAHDAVFFKDLKSRYIVVNNKTLEAFGLPAEQVIGKNDYEIMPNKDEARRNIEDDNIVFKTGKPTEITKRMTDAEGKQRWFQGIKVPQFDENGKIIGLVGIARDITGRTQAEQELQVKTAILQNIISNIPYYVFWKDKNSVYLGCNDNFAKLAGLEKPEDIIGKTDYDLPWKKEESDFYRKIDKEVVSKGAPILNIEEPVHHGKGKVATILTSKVQLRNSDGEITGILGIFTDITERKKAELELKQQEETLRAVLNATTESVFLIDIEGFILTLNDTAAKRLGRDPSEIIGQKAETLIDQNLPGSVLQFRLGKINQVFRTGKPVEFEDERYGILFHTVAYPVFDQTGKVVNVAIFGQDITAQKKAKEKIKQIAKQWSTTFDSITDLVSIQSKDFKIIKVNKAFADLFKLEPDELIGRFCYEVIHGTKEPWPTCPHKQVLETGKPATVEYFEPNLGLYLQVSASPIFDDSGEITGTVHIAKDITEHKKAEELLRESEEKHRKLFEETTDAIFIADAKTGILTDCNRAATELVGREKSELIGKHQRILHPPQEIEGGFSKTFKQHLAEKEGQILESQVITKRGEIKDVEIRASLFELKGEKRIQALFRDITDRKKAEKQRDELLSRLNAIIENVPAWIFLKDIEGRYIAANRAFFELLPASVEDPIGRRDRDLFRKDLADTFEAEDNEVLRKGMKIKKERRVRLRNGRVVYMLIFLAPVLDHLSNIVGLVAVAIDIAERKKAEQALRQNENKYRTLLENLTQKIFLKDRNLVYVSCNENYARDLKIKPEEIAGKTDFDFYPQELAEKYRADDKTIIESKETKNIEEKYIQQGQEFIVHTVKTPVKDEQGNVTGVLGIFWDITESRRREKELDDYSKRIAQAEQLATLGSLGAALAHQLTQPLSVINLLIENTLTEMETTHYRAPMYIGVANKLKDVLTEVSRITSIAQKFRDTARRSSERIIKEVNLKAVAERTLKLFDKSARQARITLHLVDFDKLPAIYSNEEDLEQLFFALVDNAVQAACPTDEPLGRRADGKKSRQLVISSIIKGKHIELRFADNCGGIAPDHLDRIFEPFFTTKPAGEAMGLGLCIVEHIISQAGGNVRVESKLGEGTIFYVSLPINIKAR